MLFKLTKILTLLLLFPFVLTAGDEASVWYFGKYAGLNFQTSDKEPVPLLDNKFETIEGCSVFADSTGKAILYSNGREVYNWNHKLIADDLLGDPTSTQSVIILQEPKNPNRFYIFTCDAGTYTEDAINEGLNYSLVDISIGEGIFIEKNVRLKYPMSEKLAAIKHPNRMDYWILSHSWGDDSFYAFLLTKNGINEPIKSEVGTKYTSELGQWAEAGMMKIAPNGKKVAVAIPRADIIEVFDFDDMTGILSNPTILNKGEITGVYGLEFSPDGTFLYATGNLNGSKIFQYDLNELQNSKLPKAIEVAEAQVFAMQLANNGKIYLNKKETLVNDSYDSISVIHSPNLPARECKFENNAVYLGGRHTSVGLPNFDARLFYGKSIHTMKDTVLCVSKDLHLKSEIRYDTTNAISEWIGPNNFYSKSFNAFIQNLNLSHEGWYYNKIKWADYDILTIDSIYLDVNIPIELELFSKSYGADCASDSMKIFASNKYTSYKWSTGETSESITVRANGIYSLEVIDSSACYQMKTIEIQIKPVNIYLNLENSLVFQKTEIGKSQSKKISLFNPQDFPIRIKNFEIKKNNVVWKVENTITELKSGANSIDLTFTPTAPIDYFDTLRINIDNDCMDILEIPFSGSAFYIAKIKYNSQEVTPGENGFSFNVVTEIQNPYYLPKEYEYEITLKMPKDLFFFNKTIIPNRKDSIYKDDLFLTYSGKAELKSNSQYIIDWKVTPMLSNSLKNQIFYTEFKWKDAFIETTQDTGRYDIVDFCGDNLRAIEFYRYPTLEIVPNPADEETTVLIQTSYKGLYAISLFDIQGKELNSYSAIKKDDSEEYLELIIDTKSLMNGVYIVNVKLPNQDNINKQLNVSH